VPNFSGGEERESEAWPSTSPPGTRSDLVAAEFDFIHLVSWTTDSIWTRWGKGEDAVGGSEAASAGADGGVGGAEAKNCEVAAG
jgi:hypothetical protein